jgi:hypothetical protein
MITKKIATAMFLLLFVSTLGLSAETPVKQGPKAVLTERIYEFEPVVEGTLVSHRFILQNKGDAPLIIEKIKTG